MNINEKEFFKSYVINKLIKLKKESGLKLLYEIKEELETKWYLYSDEQRSKIKMGRKIKYYL